MTGFQGGGSVHRGTDGARSWMAPVLLWLLAAPAGAREASDPENPGGHLDDRDRRRHRPHERRGGHCRAGCHLIGGPAVVPASSGRALSGRRVDTPCRARCDLPRRRLAGLAATGRDLSVRRPAGPGITCRRPGPGVAGASGLGRRGERGPLAPGLLRPRRPRGRIPANHRLARRRSLRHPRGGAGRGNRPRLGPGRGLGPRARALELEVPRRQRSGRTLRWSSSPSG